jgi:hypothetical protein
MVATAVIMVAIAVIMVDIAVIMVDTMDTTVDIAGIIENEPSRLTGSRAKHH